MSKGPPHSRFSSLGANRRKVEPALISSGKARPGVFPGSMTDRRRETRRKETVISSDDQLLAGRSKMGTRSKCWMVNRSCTLDTQRMSV